MTAKNKNIETPNKYNCFAFSGNTCIALNDDAHVCDEKSHNGCKFYKQKDQYVSDYLDIYGVEPPEDMIFTR